MFGRPFHLLSSLTPHLRWQVQVSTFLWMFDSCLDLDCLWKALPLSQVSQQPHSGWLSIVQKASKDPGDIFSASIKLLVWFHLSPPSDCSAKGWGSGWRFIFLRRKTLSVQPSESRAQWQVCALQLQWTLVQTRVLQSDAFCKTLPYSVLRSHDSVQRCGAKRWTDSVQWNDAVRWWCTPLMLEMRLARVKKMRNCPGGETLHWRSDGGVVLGDDDLMIFLMKIRETASSVNICSRNSHWSVVGHFHHSSQEDYLWKPADLYSLVAIVMMIGGGGSWM